MLARTQARWSRRGRAKCVCTSSVCRVSSLQRWLLNRYISGLNSWYECYCCFAVCPPSLSLTLIKITSVYIYANTWQAADAPFSTLCSNKSIKKTKAREGESRTGAHLGVQPLAWSRCGTPNTVGENTPGHIQQQNKGKGEHSPLLQTIYSHSFSPSKFKREQGVLSMYGGQFHLQIECTKSAYS